MKPYKVFYHLASFAFGGAFVFLTLGGYTPQTLVNTGLGVISILVGLLFKKYSNENK